MAFLLLLYQNGAWGASPEGVINLQFLRHTQFCAAGTGVLLQFCLAWQNRLSGNHLYLGFLPAYTHGKILWTRTSGGQIGKRLFYDPVFQGVEGDNGNASAFPKHAHRRPNGRLDHIKLCIDLDSQCLERSLGGVMPAIPGSCGYGPFYDTNQFPCGSDRRLLACPKDGLNTTASTPEA